MPKHLDTLKNTAYALTTVTLKTEPTTVFVSTTIANTHDSDIFRPRC